MFTASVGEQRVDCDVTILFEIFSLLYTALDCLSLHSGVCKVNKRDGHCTHSPKDESERTVPSENESDPTINRLVKYLNAIFSKYCTCCYSCNIYK